MRARAFLSSTLTVIVSVFLAVALLEGSVRLLDVLAPKEARSWTEHRLRIPPPYRDAPYSVERMVAEDLEITWQTGPGFGWLPDDHQGEYINTAGGRRRTTGQPADVRRRVWLFGGSTVLGAEVPDGLTIASQLQAILNESELQGIAVENMGATTISTAHQLYRLLNMTPVAAEDVVIFYDGVNDAVQALYYQNPNGTMIEGNHEIVQRLPWINQWLFTLYRVLHPYSAFVDRFLDPTSPAYREISISNELLQGLGDAYYQNIGAARAFAESRGARFLHFLQPNIYTVSRQSAYELELASNGWLYPANLRDVFRVGYSKLRQVLKELQEAGVRTFDLTGVLDTREREVFLDFCHINEHGNALVARAIAEQLHPLFR